MYQEPNAKKQAWQAAQAKRQAEEERCYRQHVTPQMRYQMAQERENDK